jgi:hypothetical protein
MVTLRLGSGRLFPRWARWARVGGAFVCVARAKAVLSARKRCAGKGRELLRERTWIIGKKAGAAGVACERRKQNCQPTTRFVLFPTRPRSPPPMSSSPAVQDCRCPLPLLVKLSRTPAGSARWGDATAVWWSAEGKKLGTCSTAAKTCPLVQVSTPLIPK